MVEAHTVTPQPLSGLFVIPYGVRVLDARRNSKAQYYNSHARTSRTESPILANGRY